MNATQHPRARHALRWTVALVLCALATGTAFAQDSMQATAAEAQELVAAQQWDRARQLLQGADQACQDDHCRARLEFTRGYLYQRWAAAEPSRRDDLLRRSARHYLMARDLAPRNETIWLNECTVRRDLGEWGYLERAFGYAAEMWPSERVRHLVIHGDFHATAGHLDRAQQLYREALALDPEDEAALRGLLAAQRRDPGVTGADIDAQARQFTERQLWRPAAASLELLIARSHVEDPSLADQALVRWVDARLASGNLSSGSLRNLPSPDAWSSPGLAELAAVLVDPAALDLGWWRNDDLRADVMARVLLMLGRRLRNEGRVGDAVLVLERAREVAPSFELYRREPLRGRRVVAPDAALELCLIYSTQEEKQQRFRRLERELFDGKRRAYLGDDLAAIQRYHTVLALIYVDRNRVTSDWADNAVFQLEHALKTSQRREEQEDGYLQPLPELRVLLADSYLKRAEVTGADGDRARADAATQYMNAARDHLDLDQLQAAASTLERCRATDSRIDRRHGAELAGLDRILKSRLGLAGASAAAWNPGADGRPALAAADAWAVTDELPGLDADFVQRQRFKLLGDLGRLAGQLDDAAAARYFNGSAVSALPATRGLASRRDVERLERINRAVAQDVSFRGHAGQVTLPRGRVDAATAETARVYYVQSPRGPQPVVVNPDLLLASEVLREVSLADDEPAGGKQLIIEAGRVEIDPRVLQRVNSEAAEEAMKTIDRIEKSKQEK